MHWRLDPVGGYGIAALVAALLLVLPLVVGPARRALSAGKRRTLIAIRLAATLLLLVAWLRPALVTVRSEPLPATLLLLVDASRSMTVEDGLDGASRWESAGRVLAASREAIAGVAEEQDVRAYAFADRLSPLAIDERGGVALPRSPTGGETALGGALSDLLADHAGGRVMGVAVLSDGAQRAFPPRDLAPLVAARRLRNEGVPLWAFPLGDRLTSGGADLAIEDLVVSERAFAGAPLDATARLRVDGYANREVAVRLLWENAEGDPEVVDSRRVVTRPGVSVYPIALRHTPSAAGEWKLTVQAEPLEGETLTGNNQVSTFVTVREGGVRVLYLVGATRVGGSPGVEQRFVRASLAASPDLVVERLSFNYEPPEPNLSRRLDAEPFDVVIVDNVDSRAVDGRTWLRLAEQVERGAGLAMLGGAHSFGPGGHRGTALADVLPIELGRAERQNFDAPVRDDVHLPGPLAMRPTTPLGARHPILQLGGDDPLQAWSRLPPLDGANRLQRSRLKPNAALLAEAGDGGAPLLVAGQPGLGRALAFAGDSTWRWVLAGEGDAHRRFWRQAVLWLAKQDDKSGEAVYLELASRRVAPGAPIEIVGGVRLPKPDDAKNAAAAANLRYEATVTLPGGGARALALPGGRARSSTVFRDTRADGDYTVSLRGYDGDQLLGETRARFLAPRVDLELDRPAAEPDTLARLAEATADAGGALLAPEELPDLLARLADREPDRRQEITNTATPWDTWPFLLLFVGLMSTEWWLRRRWGMP